MSDVPSCSRGDIVQIVDEAHAWYGCLLIVDEVKLWGVLAAALIPRSNDGSEPIAQAWNRLTYGCFAIVGRVQRDVL